MRREAAGAKAAYRAMLMRGCNCSVATQVRLRAQEVPTKTSLDSIFGTPAIDFTMKYQPFAISGTGLQLGSTVHRLI
jgi:hypothetical protein